MPLMDQYGGVLQNLDSSDAESQKKGLATLEKLFNDPSLHSEWKTLSKEKCTDLLSKLCKFISTTTDEITCCKGIACLKKIARVADLTNDQIKLCLNAVKSLVNKTRNFSDTAELEAVRAIESLLNFFPTATESMASEWFELIFLRTVHSSTSTRHLAMHIFLERKSFLQQKIELIVSCIPQLRSDIVPKMKELLNEDTSIEILKLWGGIVHILGDVLHRGSSLINCLLEVMDKAFRSNSEEVLQGACEAWKELVDNFSSNTALLTNYKRLQLLLRPLIEIIRNESEDVIHAKISTWWHLADRLGPHLESNFNMVLQPLFEYCFGKLNPSYFQNKDFSIVNIVHNERYAILVSYGVQFVGRLCESEKNNSGEASSSFILNPLKRHSPGETLFVSHSTQMAYAAMKMTMVDLPREVKLITFIWKCFTNSVKAKASYMLLRYYFRVVEMAFKANEVHSQLLFEILDMASSFPSNILLSSENYRSGDCFNANASSMLLENLLGEHVEKFAQNKRFINIFKQLTNYSSASTINVQNACRGAFQLLEKSGIKSSDTMCKIWQLLTNQLLASIELTQDINQGDDLQHDFTCVQTALLFPFKHLFQWQSLSMAVKKAMWRIWDSLFEFCVRCASIIPKFDCNKFTIEFGEKLKSRYASSSHLVLEVIETYVVTIGKLLDHIYWKTDESPGSSEFSPANSLDQYSPITWNKKKTKHLYIVIPMLSLSAHIADALIKFDESFIEKKEKRNSDNKRYSNSVITSILHVFEKLFYNLKENDIMQVFIDLAPSLTNIFERSIIDGSLFSEPKVVSKLEHVWSKITLTVAANFTGLYNTAMLNILSPLLEVTFKHNRKMINSSTWAFWHSTFAACYQKLVIPEYLKKLMEELKPKLFTSQSGDGIDDNACNGSPQFHLTGDLLENSTSKTPKITTQTGSFLKRKNLEQIAKTFSPGRTSGHLPKARKSFKSSLDQDSLSDCVYIEGTPRINILLTPYQKEMKSRRSYIPALYNDLAQDSNNSFESQVTVEETPASSISIVDSDVKSTGSSQTGNQIQELTNDNSESNGSLVTKADEEFVKCSHTSNSETASSNSQLTDNSNETKNDLSNGSTVESVRDVEAKPTSPMATSDRLQKISNDNLSSIENSELTVSVVESGISETKVSLSPKKLPSSPLSPRSCSVVLLSISARELDELHKAQASPSSTRNKRKCAGTDVLHKIMSSQKRRRVSRNIIVDSPDFAVASKREVPKVNNDTSNKNIDANTVGIEGISELQNEAVGENETSNKTATENDADKVIDMNIERNPEVLSTEIMPTLEPMTDMETIQAGNDEPPILNDVNDPVDMDANFTNELSEFLSSMSPCRVTPDKPVYCSPNGILKKCNDSVNSTPTDKRRVSFADPPVSGELIVPVPESRHFKHRTSSTVSKPSKKFIRLSTSNSLGGLRPRRDSFYKASEPIYDNLISCTLPVSQLLPYVVDPTQNRGFEKLLDSKAIHTVGDFSKLTKAEIIALPIKVPKVSNAYKGLKKFEMSLGANFQQVNLRTHENSDKENLSCSSGFLESLHDVVSEVNKDHDTADVSASRLSDELTDLLNGLSDNGRTSQIDVTSSDTGTNRNLLSPLNESFSQTMTVQMQENESQTMSESRHMGIQAVASTKNSASQSKMFPILIERSTQTGAVWINDKGIQTAVLANEISVQTERPNIVDSSTQTLRDFNGSKEKPLEHLFKQFFDGLGEISDVQWKQMNFDNIHQTHESILNLMNVIHKSWCGAKKSVSS